MVAFAQPIAFVAAPPVFIRQRGIKGAGPRPRTAKPKKPTAILCPHCGSNCQTVCAECGRVVTGKALEKAARSFTKMLDRYTNADHQREGDYPREQKQRGGIKEGADIRGLLGDAAPTPEPNCNFYFRINDDEARARLAKVLEVEDADILEVQASTIERVFSSVSEWYADKKKNNRCVFSVECEPCE